MMPKQLPNVMGIKQVYKICPFECQKVCSSAFVEGFKKGVKWIKQQKEGE